MVTASGSDTVRKSSVKRKSCYDDFGPASASVTAKPDPGKKQKQTQLQLQGTQQEEAEVEAAQVESQEDGDGDQDEIPIVVSAVGKPGPRYSNRKKVRSTASYMYDNRDRRTTADFSPLSGKHM